MILEPMAMATEDVRSKEEKLKMRSGLKSRRQSAGVKRKRDDGEDNADAEEEPEPEVEREPKKRKIRGTKGPNPLSVMKPKKAKTQDTSAAGGDSQAARNVAPAEIKQSKANAGDSTSDPASGAILNESRRRKRKRKPKEFSEDATAVVED
jgi:U3 small nucleolar RNA-associated protein 23